MSLSKVLELARADLGYTESPPNSNNTKYGERYGLQNQPWCVIALWDWFDRAGERMAFFGGRKTARCSTILRWYRSQGLTVPVSDVNVGDIVILNFSGKRVDGELDTEHCGLVTEVNRRYETKELILIQTIEGNTTPGMEGSQDNGGCVALKNRYPYQIVAVCRHPYKPEEPKKDYEGHWAQGVFEWGIKNGLIQGYKDGTYRPNDTPTRAEMFDFGKDLYDLICKQMGDDGK